MKYRIFFVQFFLMISQTCFSNTPFKENFNIWTISRDLFDFVLENVEPGSAILELGSGFSSGQFSKYYQVYSVEDNPKYLHVYPDVHYLHVPIKDRWYDPVILEKKLPKSYSAIIVDGPLGTIGRMGFYTNLHLFNPKALIIFDDVNRPAEYELMQKTATKLNKRFKIMKTNNKCWGYLHD